MTIEERIIHYLRIFDGNIGYVKKHILRDLRSDGLEESEINGRMIDALRNLESKGMIELITCDQMTEKQLHDYNLNGETLFYRIKNDT